MWNLGNLRIRTSEPIGETWITASAWEGFIGGVEAMTPSTGPRSGWWVTVAQAAVAASVIR